MIDLRQLCTSFSESGCQMSGNMENMPTIKDKIVIIGFTKGKDLDVLAMKSPFGELISGMEIQGNILTTLMTSSYYRPLATWIHSLIYILGGVISAQIIAYFNRRKYWLYLIFGLITAYLIIAIIAFYFGWILPIISPIFTWIVTAVCIGIYQINYQLIKENLRQEIAIAQEEAIVLKAKRLIVQIWHDVHDHPLQELKTAMYDVDFLGIPEEEKDMIVDRLSRVGKEIRQYMTMDVEEELSLNPKLQDGLVVAMERHLEELIDKGKLKIELFTNFDYIPEPINSNWITTRENIFVCFCETMSNVIHHGRQATKLEISLLIKDKRCILTIENDGMVVDANELKEKVGFGTKVIHQMIEYLPDGQWQRVALADGGVRVIISWTDIFS